jgi:hypothetical protein
MDLGTHSYTGTGGPFQLKVREIRVNDSFLAHSKDIDENMSSLVYSTLKQYDPNLDDQFI